MIDPSYSLAGALTGFVVGLSGVGGGALMTPVLLLFFGINPTTAVATDLWFAAITKLVGARMHHSTGNVDWQVVKRLWLGSLPVALTVVILMSTDVHILRVTWLNKVVGIVVMLTAVGLIFAPRLLAIARHRRIGNPASFKAAQPALTVAAGGVLGLCVALTSVGAGALASVILLYLYPLKMTPHRLVATDIVHAIPLAAVAGIGYLIAGMVDGAMLLSLLTGSLPAIFFGSLVVRYLSGRWVQLILACTLLAAGAKVLL